MKLRFNSLFICFILVLPVLFVVACNSQETSQTDQSKQAKLENVKTYLVKQTDTLKKYTQQLAQAGDRYYTLAKASNFDYPKLAASQHQEVGDALKQAREAWLLASPTYEKMEGIVAGVPSLSEYDVILDAGVSGSEGGEDVVPFDLTLPNGKVLEKPGNLFGVLEGTLWGTEPTFVVENISFDYDNNGKKDFGDVLANADILKSSTEATNRYAGELQAAAKKWQPTLTDAFSALVGNVPTVSDFFASWKSSRFVTGDTSTQRDFAVISRLSDITDNVTSWQTIYQGLSPLARTTDANQDTQITKELSNLKAYVQDLEKQEQNGRHFTPQEADLLSNEAQGRATAVTGQISQMAAKLKVRVEQ
jgi:hypothetical protein